MTDFIRPDVLGQLVQSSAVSGLMFSFLVYCIVRLSGLILYQPSQFPKCSAAPDVAIEPKIIRPDVIPFGRFSCMFICRGSLIHHA